MTLYCNSDWQAALQKQHLATFDQIWDYPIRWIDAPNQNRGGWSGVGCVDVLFNDKTVTLFVKKQQNHTTRTLLHPIKGVLTFAKEFQMIRFLQIHGVVAPNVIFFEERSVEEGQQAILITENLAGYRPLDSIEKNAMTLSQQRTLLRAIAQTIRHMHNLGVQHRALYTKHIFLKLDSQSYEVALIDMEKARRMVFPLLQSLMDLITLNYRTQGWTKTSRLFFMKQYLAQPQLDVWGKLFCRWIIRRTKQNQQQWNKRHE